MTEEKKNFKQTEVGLIPEDWKLVKLEDLSELLGGYAFKSSNFKSSGKFQVVKMSNVYMNDLNLNRSQSYLDKIQSSQTDYLLKSGDIIISLTGTVGKEDYGFSYRLRDETNLLLNQRLAKVSAKPDISNVFLDFQLKTRAFLKQFYELGKGGTGNQTNVSIKNLAGLHIPLPPTLEEQQAIASALSDVDELIRSLDRLIEKKEAIKKGTMQQLLTGQKRLPGFDGEWEEIRSGEVVDYINGRAYSKHEWENKGTPVVRLQNLTGSGEDYYYSNLNLPEKNYMYDGDLIFMWSASFGPYIWNGPKAIYHYHIWKIDCNEDKIDKMFYYHKLVRLTEELKQTTSGSTMLHLTKAGMEKFKLNLPQLEEQKAIAQILSDMDRELQTLRQKREKFKQVKQGMMQELLTGKVRLVAE